MQTTPDYDLPEATIRRHAAELAQVQTLLKKAQSIIDRQLGESEGRPSLLAASDDIGRQGPHRRWWRGLSPRQPRGWQGGGVPLSESPQNRARELVNRPTMLAIRKAGEEAVDKIDAGEVPIVALRAASAGTVYIELKLTAAEVAIVTVALTRMAILGDDALDRIPAAETLDTVVVQCEEAAGVI